MQDLALTDKAAAFVKNIVGGMNKTAAARDAGFAYPAQEAQRLMREPKVLAAIQSEVVRRVQTEGQAIAFNFLINTITNEKAPWGARTECARILANKGPLNDAALRAAVEQSGEKPLSERTIDELEAFIRAGTKAIQEHREKHALKGEAIDVSAQETPALPAK
jgi:phage terminase small subunit